MKITEKIAVTHKSNGRQQKIALVTGGSRGIGAEIVRRLAREHMTIAINCRTSVTEAENLVNDIRSKDGKAKTFIADVSDTRAVEKMVRQITDEFGRIDVIVHGATPPIADMKKAAQTTYADIEPFLKTYINGALALVSNSLEGMTERKFGRYIFLGTSSLFGNPPQGMAGYVVAKSALYGLVRSMAVELGPLGITTNMVSPGLTITDLTAHTSARARELEAQRSPLRRLPRAEDTAELVNFLSKEESAYLNGINFPLVGGPVQ